MSSEHASTESIGRIVTVKEAPIGWLVINNVARRNAMTMAMWAELQRGVDELSADENILVIVVAGAEGKSFCAGGDISEFGALRSAPETAAAYDAAGSAALAALFASPKPTIAMIEGYCLGGGLGIALQCDLRVASTDAKLGIPAAKRGIAYGFSGVKQLVDLIGPSQAKDVLFTGRRLDAVEGLALGLLNNIVGPATIREAVCETALEIAGNAPLSVRASKLMVNMAMADPADRDLALAGEAESRCLASEDYKEASRSFVEKRSPAFKGW